MRRDWADGAGPAVELANPVLAASPDVAVVVAGAAVDVEAGAAVVDAAAPVVAPVVADVDGLPLGNREKPPEAVAVLAAGAAPDEAAAPEKRPVLGAAVVPAAGAEGNKEGLAAAPEVAVDAGV